MSFSCFRSMCLTYQNALNCTKQCWSQCWFLIPSVMYIHVWYGVQRKEDVLECIVALWLMHVHGTTLESVPNLKKKYTSFILQKLNWIISSWRRVITSYQKALNIMHRWSNVVCVLSSQDDLHQPRPSLSVPARQSDVILMSASRTMRQCRFVR